MGWKNQIASAWKNQIASALFILTLLYAALVILNPYNFFEGGEGEKALDIGYIYVSYKHKESAIQLIGTMVIAIGIIISQEKLIPKIATLAGTLIVFIGLVTGIKHNTSLLGATLAIFPITISLIIIGIGIHILTFFAIVWLKRCINYMREKAMNLINPISSRISRWTRRIWRTINRL